MPPYPLRLLVKIHTSVLLTMPMRKLILKQIKHHAVLCSVLLLVPACSSAPVQETTSRTPAKTVQAFHHKNLEQIFSGYSYSWDNLNQGVPPLILTQFPEDLHLIHSVKQKKELFFRTVLPMAMLANEEILDQRDALEKIFQDFDREAFLTVQQQEKLSSILKHYRLKTDPLSDKNTRALLFSRVDSIPESLVLAQAANESGWGTSRFAREANNIFGEWTFTPGTGLVPESRPEGEIYEVRLFSNLYQSVRSYMRNINTHRAYASLRQMRQELSQADLPASGIKLALGLTRYSTRREAYADEIQAMIRSNRLEQITAKTHLRPDASLPAIETVLTTTGLLSSKETLIKKAESH